MRNRKGLSWKEFLAFFLVIVLIGIFFEVAEAGEATLSWTNPDRTFTLTDAGPYTNPAGTRIYMLVADTADPAATSITVPALKPGSYNFVAVAYSDTGEASPVSSEATKEITEFVTIDTVAKIVAKTNGKFLLLAVGTVPLGTPCDPTTEVNDHFAIPREAVTFTGASDVIVVARCG